MTGATPREPKRKKHQCRQGPWIAGGVGADWLVGVLGPPLLTWLLTGPLPDVGLVDGMVLTLALTVAAALRGADRTKWA